MGPIWWDPFGRTHSVGPIRWDPFGGIHSVGPILWEGFTDFADFFHGKFAGINFHVLVNRDLFINVCKDALYTGKYKNVTSCFVLHQARSHVQAESG